MDAADAALSAPVTALSITDEEKEKRLNLASSPKAPDSIAASAASDPDRRRQLEELRREFSLEDGSRPFMSAVFEAMECQENDYLPLFALCLIYALQQNSGEYFSDIKSGRPEKVSKEKKHFEHSRTVSKIVQSSCT
jgi:hypothetical protein